MAKGKSHTVNPSSKGSSPSGVVAGGPGRSLAAIAMPKGGSGQPVSMRKALSKKAPRGAATGFAGSVR